MTDFYVASSDPADGTDAEPSVLRAEHAAIAAGFAKLAGYTGNGGKAVAINAGGTAYEAVSCTGTGNFVRAGSPTLTAPTLGAATATSINKVAITAPATGATLTIAEGKTLTASNTLTLAGTDSSTLNIDNGSNLTKIAALTAAANKLPYATGAATWAMADFSASGRSLINIGITAAGDTIYGTAADTVAKLAIGAAGTVYESTGTAPSWVARPAFSANNNNSNQTGIVSGVATLIAFGTEVFDTNNNFASSRFTPTVAGKYLLTAVVRWSVGADQTASYIQINKNGAGLHVGTIVECSGTGPYSTHVSAVVDANGSGDYFEIFGVQNTGSNQSTDGTVAYTYFTGARVG